MSAEGVKYHSIENVIACFKGQRLFYFKMILENG